MAVGAVGHRLVAGRREGSQRLLVVLQAAVDEFAVEFIQGACLGRERQQGLPVLPSICICCSLGKPGIHSLPARRQPQG